jgi:hypothetical protein
VATVYSYVRITDEERGYSPNPCALFESCAVPLIRPGVSAVSAVSAIAGLANATLATSSVCLHRFDPLECSFHHQCMNIWYL